MSPVETFRKLLTDRLAAHAWQLNTCRKTHNFDSNLYYDARAGTAELSLLLDAFNREFPPEQ